MNFDIDDGDLDEPETTEDRLEGGWLEELKSKMENRLFNYSYAKLLDHHWTVDDSEALFPECLASLPRPVPHTSDENCVRSLASPRSDKCARAEIQGHIGFHPMLVKCILCAWELRCLENTNG